MSECILCKKKANLFAKKISDGLVCADCQRFISPNTAFSAENRDHLEKVIEKNKKLSEIFDYTTNYGNLYLDAIHSMFCVSRKEDKQGEPTEFGEIYYIEDLKSVGLFCANVKNIGSNGRDRIVCDVKFKYTTKDVSREYIIAKKQACSYEYRSGSQLEWNEPGDFQVFRNTFDTILKGVYDVWIKRLENLEEMKEIAGKGEHNLSWAKGVLFISPDDEVSQADIKERRNKLVKIFHPDMTKTGDAAIALQINEAYKMLSND